MKKRTVITNTPIKFPLTSTILYTFLLYHFNVAGWIWGVFITIEVIYWILLIIGKWYEEQIDLMDTEPNEEKRKFADRLYEMMSKREKK